MPRYRRISWPHISPGSSTGSSSKAAREQEPEMWAVWYVESLNEARTPPETTFHVPDPAAQQGHPARPQRRKNRRRTLCGTSRIPSTRERSRRSCSAAGVPIGCSKRLSGKAAASERARRTLSGTSSPGTKRERRREPFSASCYMKGGSGAYTTGIPNSRSSHPAIWSSPNGARLSRASN